jgi:hypothetical protein
MSRRYSGPHQQKWEKFLLILGVFLLITGCARKIIAPTKVKPEPSEVLLNRTGYTIQVGAFRDPNNASRLTQSLNSYDLNAYYFQHQSGFLKVRFGNFPTAHAARNKAESLQAAGIISEFFIVHPESHAVERLRIRGSDYLRDEIVRRARNFIGLPYQWGGSHPDEGFDCSGLTQAVYHLVGLNLPRTSREQFETGRVISMNNIRKGDLIFFSTTGSRKVSHVGIYTGDSLFIHAPGKNKKICLEKLSKPYFQNRFSGARTYLHLVLN